MSSNEWRGPGKVIGRDGQQIIIKHGGLFVRAHPTRLQVLRNTAQVSNGCENPENENLIQTNENESGCLDLGSDEEDAQDIPEEKTEDISGSTSSSVENEVDMPEETATHESETDGMKNDQIDRRPKPMSRAGKATGRNKDFYNLSFSNRSKMCVNLKERAECREIMNEEEVLVTNTTEEYIQDAKAKELRAWKDNSVYEECQSVSNDPISLRWVITEKIDGKCHVKARLVARGFESFDQRCDSPTCSKENIRLVFAIISSNGWSLRSLDIKEAFLQGDMIDRNVFVVPPKEAEIDAIWRLKKKLYMG